jgi:hypothetical protein
MENTLEIVVTQEDIDEGSQSHCSACPIAKATSRAIGMKVRVGVSQIEVTEGVIYEMPVEARVFVGTFDRLGPSFVKPLTFVAERAL